MIPQNHINLFHICRNLIFLALLFTASSCFSVKYSTTGAAISPDLKTISVLYFSNRSATAPPNLARDFTEKLRNKCLSNTRLTMIVDGGDASFEGDITGWEVTNGSLQSGDKPSTNRFTITVHVKFTNSAEPKFNYDTSFSEHQDFPSSQDISAVSNDLTTKISDLLLEDIFNKAFANW